MLVRDVRRVNYGAGNPGCQPPKGAGLLGCSRTRQRTGNHAHDKIRKAEKQRMKPPLVTHSRGTITCFSIVHVAPLIPLLRPSDSSSILVKFSFPSVSCHLYLPGLASFEAIGPFSSLNS